MSHAKRFWELWRPEVDLYEHLREAIEVAEEHREEDQLCAVLATELPAMSPQHQNDVLCALADTEMKIPEHLQRVIIALLNSTSRRVAMGAASCLLACAGRAGRYHIMTVLACSDPPQKVFIRGLLHMHQQTTTGDDTE